MYVGDAVQGILALAARVHLPSVQGNAFTFASGKLCAVKEVAAAIEKLLHGKGHITFDGKALSDRDQHAFEIDSTKELLGWQPRVGLEEGLERTWQWYVAHEKNSQNQFRRNQS
jgi:nucleoside-diphosphate-sugar epimerase